MPRVRRKPADGTVPAETLTAAARTPDMFEHKPVLGNVAAEQPTGSQIPSLPPETTQKPQDVGARRPHAAHHRAMVEGEGSVTVTWGEELYTPVQFYSYRVGPFTVTANVLAGETVFQATHRLMDELEEVAHAERTRKRAAFEAAIRSVGIGRPS